MVPCESTAEEFSLEWSYHRIWSTDSKVIYILNKYYQVKVLLKRFHLNGNTTGFHPQTQKLEGVRTK